MSSPTADSDRAGWANRARSRASRLPLRTRMLVAMTALVAGVCLVVGGLSLVLLREYLIHQLDAQLLGAGNRLVAAASRDPDDHDSSDGTTDGSSGAPSGAPSGSNSGATSGSSTGTSSGGSSGGSGDGSSGHSHGHRSGLLFGRAQQVGTLGAIILHGEVQRAAVLDKNGFSQVLGDDADLLRVPVNNHPRTVRLDDLGDYRLYAVTGQSDRIFVIGLPLEDVNETLASLAVIILTVASGGLVLAALASTLVVRVTLRPLSRVAGTAGRVAELRLDRGEVALAERVGPADTDPRTEVGQVGNALNRMLEHVASALEARQASETQLRQFLADASHELRTPLAAIRGYAELTRRSAEDSMPPEVAHALRRITSQAERMTSLVEDMLLLARLDAGRPLAREPVDLSQLVVDAVSDAHAAGLDHRWTLRLPDEAVIVPGDSTRLAQVLANLLTNARVHTPPGTTVRAELTGDSTSALIRVVDDGPGIPAALLPHVFGRFARGDTSRSRAAGSTGLGLAIAHAVVVAHGGQVEVRSVPGQTVFTVRLPYQLPAEATVNGRHGAVPGIDGVPPARAALASRPAATNGAIGGSQPQPAADQLNG